jgi:hypothetical protein
MNWCNVLKSNKVCYALATVADVFQIAKRSPLPYDPKAKAAQRDRSGRYYPSLPPSDFANFAGMASESLALTGARSGLVARFSHSCGSASWS